MKSLAIVLIALVCAFVGCSALPQWTAEYGGSGGDFLEYRGGRFRRQLRYPPYWSPRYPPYWPPRYPPYWPPRYPPYWPPRYPPYGGRYPPYGRPRVEADEWGK
uniref:Lipoprotein n=1 Tax=Parascaris univalens TaxID=6257 RepID=A0A914ZQE5_PARUN